MINKTNIGLKIIAGLVLLSFIPHVSATSSYELFCLDSGEQVDLGVLCNPRMESRTGPINLCMKIQDNGNVCPTNPNICNNLGLGCSEISGGSTELDITPPEISITSPVEGELFTERSILLDLDVSEISDIKFRKAGESNWKNICSDCSAYARSRSFDEGLNELTFWVIDRAGNEAFSDLSFYVDSKKPKISKTEPKKGFASGEFSIEFKEDNPSSLVINYGSFDNNRNFVVDLDTCVNTKGNKYRCDFNINLEDFDGQSIEYYATLKDIAGNSVVSKSTELMVDYSAPIITSFSNEVVGKKVYFIIGVDEPFLDKIVYMDNFDRKPKEKKLCSKLVDGLCEKKINFKDGNHEVIITVIDKAGNSVSQSVYLFTDSKKPKISKTEPKKGFASGEFSVEFKEDNAEKLTLFYGVFGDMRTRDLSISDDCFEDRNKMKCSTSVDVSDFDGEEIIYYFELTDVVGQTATSKEISLDVDVTFPMINDISWEVDGNHAKVKLNVSELNFDEATYINYNDRNPREKKLCSKIRDNLCSKRIVLNDGTNSIDIIVSDKVGNSVGQNIEIEHI